MPRCAIVYGASGFADSPARRASKDQPCRRGGLV